MIKSELKVLYKDLVRAGKPDEAQEVLKKLWANDFSETKIVEPIKVKEESKILEKVEEPKEVKKKEPERDILDNLLSIRGIGKETLEDIKRIYSSSDELKKALIEDKVPLRNNQVKNLREYYKL